MSESDSAPRSAELSAEELLEIFSVLSHDLKSPIFTIDGFSELLVGDYGEKLDDEGKDFLARIRSAAHQMRHILDEMSHMIKLLNRPSAARQISLGEVVEELERKYAPACEQRGVTFEIDGEMPVVHADPEKVREALGALISNAIFFNDRPEGERTVRLFSERRDGGVRCCVEDNGIGIDPRYQAQIFQLGLKLDKSRGGGPGFGLYLAKRAIESQGGWLTVDSTLQKGSTFCLVLPQ